MKTYSLWKASWPARKSEKEKIIYNVETINNFEILDTPEEKLDATDTNTKKLGYKNKSWSFQLQGVS